MSSSTDSAPSSDVPTESGSSPTVTPSTVSAPIKPALPTTSGSANQDSLDEVQPPTQKRLHEPPDHQSVSNGNVIKKPRVEGYKNNVIEETSNDNGGNNGAEDVDAENVLHSNEKRDDRNCSPQILTLDEKPGTEKSLGDAISDRKEAPDSETNLSQDLNVTSTGNEVAERFDNSNDDKQSEDGSVGSVDDDWMVDSNSSSEEDDEENFEKSLLDVEDKLNNDELLFRVEIQEEIDAKERIWHEKYNLMKPEVETPNFTLGEQRASGGFGRIYNAVYNKEAVAVKVIFADPDAVPSISIEEEVMSTTMGHPNLISLLKSFHTYEFSLFVMPVAEKSLQDLIESSSARITEKRAKRIFAGILEGLLHLHNKGFAHRDLKCQNVLMFRGDTPCICDYGISHRLSDGQCCVYDGTPSHRAPELWREVPHDPKKSDIWSCGVLLTFMLTKELPFKSSPATLTTKPRSLKRNVIRGRRDPDCLVHISKNAADLIDNILKLNPEDRLSLKEIMAHKWLHEV